MHPHSVNAADVQWFADVFGLTGSPTHTSTGWQVQGTSAVLSFIISDGDVTVSYASGVPSAVGGSAGSAGTAIPPSSVTNGPLQVAPPAPTNTDSDTCTGSDTDDRDLATRTAG